MNEKKLNEKDIKQLILMKEKILKKCNKKGCDDFNNIKHCTCFEKYVYLKELHYSRIPRDYWFLELFTLSVKNIYKKYAINYINNIDNALTNGLGIMYCGPKRGIGKTSSMSIIGKEAIKKGYSAYYVIAQNIIDDRFAKESNIIDRIKECDLILIDELDKVLMKTESNVPKMIENLLREILPNKKSVIICTNLTVEEVEEKFAIISLLKRYMKIIPMDGDDYSQYLEDKWSERLKENDIDFNDKILIKESKIYFKNRKSVND